jgi:hypothetical protein
VTIDTRWMDVEKVLQPAPQTAQELRERAVQDIAQARFEFPTPEHPSFRTYVNVPEVTLPVQDESGKELVPDIVVVDTPGNITKIVVRVEVAPDVTEERARSDWQHLARLHDVAFYLYVPVGYGAVAKRICRKLGIVPYGYRTWRYTPHGLEINEISEPPGIIHALMPPIVRKILRGE